ncbi:MAG TPA: tyrosine-type recombinase/integrase [Candidatus Udaeobacter sp.]|nr:tyrosine-type recombinase/integrase [Candidatus Udaeobacter sp.]
MASLIKRPTSQFWVACFTDRTGRRLKRSTATANRKLAQKIADNYEAAACRKRTALQVRRVISSLHQEIAGEEVLQTTLRAFVDSWLERKEPEIAQATASFYRNAANKFLAFMSDRADADLTEINRDDIIRFRNDESKRFAPKTVNHEIKFLRMIFRAAKRDALISDDPAEFVDTVRRGKAMVRRPFSIAEIKAVLSVADPEWRSMILFGLYTGQRLGDVATLTWQNIDLQQGEIRLVTHKTYKTLILPMAAPLRKHIEALPVSDDPVTPVHRRAFAIVTKQGKSGHLSNQFADLLAQAGLREKKPHRKTGTTGIGRGRGSASGGLSFHCLRHTAVTMMKEANVPAAVVMELVGHDSERMSDIYTHVGAQAMQKAADSLPDVV